MGGFSEGLGMLHQQCSIHPLFSYPPSSALTKNWMLNEYPQNAPHNEVSALLSISHFSSLNLVREEFEFTWVICICLVSWV